MQKKNDPSQDPDDIESLRKRIQELEAAAAKGEEKQQALALDSFNLFTLMERIPDSIYFKDLESRFIRVSRSWANKHDLHSPAQAIAKTDYDFFLPEFAEQTLRDEQKIIQTGKTISKVEKFVTDGETTWCSSTKIPVRDLDNTIIGTCGVTRDITAVKRAEEILAETNTLLEQRVIEKTQDLLIANHCLEERIQQLDFINKVSHTFSKKITAEETSQAIVSAFCEYFASAEGALCQFVHGQYTVRCTTPHLRRGQRALFSPSARRALRPQCAAGNAARAAAG